MYHQTTIHISLRILDNNFYIMSIIIKCDSCNRMYNVWEDKEWKKLKCKCWNIFLAKWIEKESKWWLKDFFLSFIIWLWIFLLIQFLIWIFFKYSWIKPSIISIYSWYFILFSIFIFLNYKKGKLYRSIWVFIVLLLISLLFLYISHNTKIVQENTNKMLNEQLERNQRIMDQLDSEFGTYWWFK